VLYRARLGLRQADLAALSGVSADTIRRVEGGKHVPSYATLTKIAAALQCTVSQLTLPIT
jgi:transcriptional regulator with XRE-family HTH domain